MAATRSPGIGSPVDLRTTSPSSVTCAAAAAENSRNTSSCFRMASPPRAAHGGAQRPFGFRAYLEAVCEHFRIAQLGGCCEGMRSAFRPHIRLVLAGEKMLQNEPAIGAGKQIPRRTANRIALQLDPHRRCGGRAFGHEPPFYIRSGGEGEIDSLHLFRWS